ncbi:MAG: tetratricopeptide repeat protein, partial [Bacteroidota bacterium]
GIFKLQDEIAGAVVKQLKLKLLTGPSKSAASSPAKIEVHNLLLQGKFFHDKLNKESVHKAVDFYQQAIAIDSFNARAWALLASGYSRQAWQNYIDQKEGYEKAREAALKAIGLDDGLANGHLVLGDIKLYHDFDWKGAEAEFQKALALEPSNADILRSIGSLHSTLGHSDEAIRVTKQSIDLDPLRPITHMNQGNNLTYVNRYDEAIVSFKKALELNPQFERAHIYIGRTKLLQGKPEMALAEMQQETGEGFRTFGMALAYHALGRKKEANEVLNDFVSKYQNNWKYLIAEIYAYRGEKDTGMQWLEKAYKEKDSWLFWLKGDPLLKNLESDPRYAALLKKMGLEK